MRRVFLRLEVVAVVVVAACLVALSAAHEPARAQIQLLAGPGGPLALSNDKEGSAVLSLAGMRPGDSVTDTVTLGNTGTVPGDLSLSTSNLVDAPGAGGGALSGKLDMRVRDVTVPGSPVTVYDDTIDAFTPVALGTLAAGDSRVYEFRVAFPDAGPGAENAYQGSTMSVRLDWTAVNNGPDTDPPETTITSKPGAVSASPAATFGFTADEPGSTFECALDGGAFAACTSPASYSGLADGAHAFAVRATDGSGNTDPTPDSASWTVDQTAPTVSLADPGSPLRGTVTLEPAADDGSGTGVASLIVQRSPAGAGTWTPTGTSWDTTSVADGEYDLRARATDAAGNAASSAVVTVRVDNGPPSKPKKFAGARKNHRLVLGWKPATDRGGAIAAYLVYVDGKRAKTLGGSTLSVDMGPFKTSDSRSFQVAARDTAGNVGKKTHALVVVPSLSRLTVAKAKQRLAGRGLRAGDLEYAYSATVPAGLVIGAQSGVVPKGSAVRLTVSRGARAGGGSDRPTNTGNGGGTYDYTPGPGTVTPTGSGLPPTGQGTTTPPPPPPAQVTDGSGDSGAGDAGPTESGQEARAVVPTSFAPDDGASPLRRLLGLGLLGGSFLATGAAALRARGPRGVRAGGQQGLEPIVFWDERLLHAVSSALRRLGGRL